MADSRSEFLRLRDVDSSFQNRSNSIFERLGSLEQSNENYTVRTELEIAGKQQRNQTGTRSRNSPRSGSRRLPAGVPQHVLSPEKWTKYSLENDGSENFRGMNEHSLNKHAAHSFLADLKKRKSVGKSRSTIIGDSADTEYGNIEGVVERQSKRKVNESKTDNVKSDEVAINEQTLVKENLEKVDILNDDDDSKLLFRKPSPKIDMTSPSSTHTWRNGAFVMPEYVVGSSRAKESPRVRKSSGLKQVASDRLVNLGHLEDQDGVTPEIKEEKTGKQKGRRNFRKRKMGEGKDECEENTN
ncbi:uncharacterized protein LOC114518252 [Dendronephthya gigantea]|uniref:uncharacterized protein LOC114518252 n=1 Tax=Dendronephthya gigantea TaxID=151771 RepID=UPI001069F3F5|nr:uncharacterized protein LOC114518252 [Dendronephthya gigantea]